MCPTRVVPGATAAPLLTVLADGTIHLQWGPPLVPNGEILHYRVYGNHIQNPAPAATVNGSVFSVNLTHLSSDTVCVRCFVTLYLTRGISCMPSPSLPRRPPALVLRATQHMLAQPPARCSSAKL